MLIGTYNRSFPVPTLLEITPIILPPCCSSEVSDDHMLLFVQLFLTVFISDTLTNAFSHNYLKGLGINILIRYNLLPFITFGF